MKKVSLMILLVIVLSTVLMAAVPTKMVRLTVINKSDPGTSAGDYAVYMKLTGSSVTNAFYYLTVPTGSRDEPTIKIFTLMSDVYSRETWQCNGLKSSGNLVVAGNLRLTFTQCGEVKLYCSWYNDANADGILTPDEYLGKGICGREVPQAPVVPVGVNNGKPAPAPDVWNPVFVTSRTWRVAGEPTQEKVTYFKILRNQAGDFPFDLAFDWNAIQLYGGFWTTGSATFWWRSYTWKTPVGCNWYYQY